MAAPAVDEYGLVGHDRVRDAVAAMLRAAQAQGWTDERLAALSRVKARTIRSYRCEGKVPNLAAALSLASVLGDWAVSQLLVVIGYQAQALEGGETLRPGAVVAGVATNLAVIAAAAADGRIDHTEEADVAIAADQIIATVLPYSSSGRAA